VSVCVCEGGWIQRCGMVKVGLGISRAHVYCHWNLVYKTFIECIFVETSQFVSINPNVIRVCTLCLSL